MEARKLLPALTLVILLVFATIIWFYPPTGDFNAGNPFWNGISYLSEHTEVSPINSLDSLPSSGKGSTLLLVPYEQFSSEELNQIRSFVSSGGTLLLLDDYGFGNQVLGSLGLKTKFTGQQLLDPLFDYQNEMMPKITEFTPTSMTANVSSIVFNHATTLEDTSDVSVIASSSRFSFLDANNNGEWDTDELSGSLPVAAYVKVDEGYVVAVADPSMLINGMINMDDNLRFIDNLLSIQGANSQVYVDQSHLPKMPLDDAQANLAAVYSVVASPLGTLSLIVVILALSLKTIFKRREGA